MLLTGKSSTEINHFKDLLTNLENQGVLTKKCKQLIAKKKGKEALACVEETHKKLRKAIEAAQKDKVSELSATKMIDKANQEQLDLIVLDMAVTDIDPIVLCQKIKEAY